MASNPRKSRIDRIDRMLSAGVGIFLSCGLAACCSIPFFGIWPIVAILIALLLLGTIGEIIGH